VLAKLIDFVATSSTNSLHESVPAGLTKISDITRDWLFAVWVEAGPAKKNKATIPNSLNRFFIVSQPRNYPCVVMLM
jgi:hypothetical protein